MKLLLDPFRMIRDIGRASRAVNAWGAALNVPQVVGGVLFLTTLEGQLVLATVIATLIVAGQIHRKMPFSRLIGLCHIPWLALLPWLVVRLLVQEHSIALQLWGYYVAMTIAISLVFDAIDVYRFTKGQKTFAWASSPASVD
jgi:hypothetical protein